MSQGILNVDSEPLKCSICMRKIKEDSNKNKTVTECGHTFHADHLLKWGITNNSCPVCRKLLFATAYESEPEIEIDDMGFPEIRRRDTYEEVEPESGSDPDVNEFRRARERGPREASAFFRRDRGYIKVVFMRRIVSCLFIMITIWFLFECPFGGIHIPIECNEANCLVKFDGSICTIRFIDANMTMPIHKFNKCESNSRIIPCNVGIALSTSPITKCKGNLPGYHRRRYLFAASFAIVTCTAMILSYIIQALYLDLRNRLNRAHFIFF